MNRTANQNSWLDLRLHYTSLPGNRLTGNLARLHHQDPRLLWRVLECEDEYDSEPEDTERAADSTESASDAQSATHIDD